MQKTEIYITTYDQGYPITYIHDERCEKLCELDGILHLTLEGLNREFRLKENDSDIISNLDIAKEINIFSENGLVRRLFFTKK